ncbi:MAG: hypothetical protein L6Q78_15025 [Bacteroidia bacterium]|nr:hypothetical protein [Bacteroidia bacterium]
MYQELGIIFSIVLLLLFFLWVRSNVRLSDNCPKCGNNTYVKRVPRSFITKYLLFFIAPKKLRCNKCWKDFYQLWGPDKPEQLGKKSSTGVEAQLAQ